MIARPNEVKILSRIAEQAISFIYAPCTTYMDQLPIIPSACFWQRINDWQIGRLRFCTLIQSELRFHSIINRHTSIREAMRNCTNFFPRLPFIPSRQLSFPAALRTRERVGSALQQHSQRISSARKKDQHNNH